MRNLLKPGVQIMNEDVVGAVLTGNAPTTSEWSTSLLPTKVWNLLEVWWYVIPKSTHNSGMMIDSHGRPCHISGYLFKGASSNHCVDFVKKIFTILSLSTMCAHTRNPSLRRTRICWPFVVKMMVAEDLGIQGARAWAAMLSQNILVSAPSRFALQKRSSDKFWYLTNFGF